jgi:hypothetical protein
MFKALKNRNSVLLLTSKRDLYFGVPGTIEYIYHTFTFQSLLFKGLVSEYFMIFEEARALPGKSILQWVLSDRV